MINIPQKALADLEFDTILEYVENHCVSSLGKERIRNLKPFSEKSVLFQQLEMVNEYSSSIESDNKIPSHFFDDLSKEMKLLSIENSFLEPKSFLKICNCFDTTISLILFFRKFKLYFKELYKDSDKIYICKTVPNIILSKITKFGEVSDKSSLALKVIRREISEIRSKIGGSFQRDLIRYSASGFLDEIKESVLDNQRVLAVSAMYRRKVKGSVMGTSKTGSIVFMVPESTQQFNRELEKSIADERQEIMRILKELTNELREYLPEIKLYQNYLTHIDTIGARAKFSKTIKGILPRIDNNKNIYLKDAYHPLLLLKDKAKIEDIVPQTLELNEKQQIIVISGPNAGGKSITLKTIGLLQVMLQSGILIPVHPKSVSSIFDTILTDIGDNQSIENQLSTYSYRLKNMRYFLRKCNENSMFLIDEFGTGSDPELGGALAEVFLEEFHAKKSFGIITTHYSNLKVLAEELPNVSNANMMFDERTLEPMYKLFVGQAGSSFTFEVAQKNGIPFSLINRAKKKVEGEKIRLDKTISKLQIERSKLQRSSDSLDRERDKTQETTELLTEKQAKVQKKLESFQELYDSNQKILTIGRQVNDMANTFFQNNSKKQLMANFFKWISIEKVKYLKKNPPIDKTKKQKKEDNKKAVVKKQELVKIEKEILKEVVEIRAVKKEKESIEARIKASYKYKIGDTVRLIDSKTSGTIDKIDKNKVSVNFGMFMTTVSLLEIELVRKAKK